MPKPANAGISSGYYRYSLTETLFKWGGIKLRKVYFYYQYLKSNKDSSATCFATCRFSTPCLQTILDQDSWWCLGWIPGFSWFFIEMYESWMSKVESNDAWFIESAALFRYSKFAWKIRYSLESRFWCGRFAITHGQYGVWAKSRNISLNPRSTEYMFNYEP